MAIKTVQDIEAGQKNTSFETLSKLIDRLGISPNDLFLSEIPDEAAIQHVIGKLQPCTPENRKILLATFDFLAEQLIAKQYGEDSGGPK